MRLRIVKSVLKKELREMLRDRRSLLVMFGLPLVLYPILTLVIATLGLSKQKQYTEEVARIAVVNLVDAPHLKEMIEARPKEFKLFTDSPGHDPKNELSAGNLSALVTIPKLPAPGYERSITHSPPPLLEADSMPSNLALALSKTPFWEFLKPLLAAKPSATAPAPPATRKAKTPPLPAPLEILVTVDRSHSEAPFVESKINTLLYDYQQWIIETRLAANHISPSILNPIEHRTLDISTGEQRLGKLLSLMLPLLLLMTGMLGAFFPALNATTTERELGTLEALLITPATRMELLTAKTLLVLFSGLLTALLNMLSMSLVLLQTFKLMSNLHTDFGISISGLALTYLAAVPAILFFSCLVMIVGLIARNFREANSFASPVMLLPICAIFVAMAEPPSTAALMLTPVVNTTLIIRDILTAHLNPWHFLLAFASSCLYAGLMLSAAVRLFTNEQLVNPAWEPLSLGFKRSRPGHPKIPRGLPSVDTGLAVFSVSLLLTLYVGVNIGNLNLLTSAFITQVGLIAAPALLMAWWSRYSWRQTFALQMPARSPLMHLLIGLLLGIVLVPIMHALSYGQTLFWPNDPQAELAQAQKMFPALVAHPYLVSLVLAALAGITEELLYRGLLQTALLRRLPVAFALGTTAILFALAHYEMHGAPIRALMGLLLGWMVYRTSSLFPAILTHFAYDATALLYTAYYVNAQGLEKVLNPSTPPGTEKFDTFWIITTLISLLIFIPALFFIQRHGTTTTNKS